MHRRYLGAEFGVLLSEHVALERYVLLLVLEGGLVVRDLLLGERFDGSSCLCEFRLSCEFFGGEGLGPRVADLTGTKGTSPSLEVDVRVGTEFSTELFDEFDRFEF